VSYPEAASNAAIDVSAKLWQKYQISNLGLVHQFLSIQIRCDGTAVSVSQKAYITTILKQFDMEHTHGLSMPMDPDVKFNLADDWGEKSLMYAALATWPDISYAVIAISHYSSRPFTSNMTAAKRVLQYVISTADC
jgi:hypothetical protein